MMLDMMFVVVKMTDPSYQRLRFLLFIYRSPLIVAPDTSRSQAIIW
jgi:hypothetical protein